MELRELRAFVVSAHELHFARAAAQLYMSPSSMTELIKRLEVELGTPLFIRTTRRITLTDAGIELLGRAETILDLAAQATGAVGAIAGGNVGTIRLGITPPAGPVIAPHLARHFTISRPEVSVDIQRMWLPALGAALQAGTIDAALAKEASIELQRLGSQTLGMHAAHLFPAWHGVQQQILATAALSPPIVELEDSDLTGRRWIHQLEIEWIMLFSSLLAGHEGTVVRPALGRTVPFTLSWQAQSTIRPILRRFVESSLDAGVPDGWVPPLADSKD
jgi:DNA-binding transcriptional LysR family regulator